MEYPAWLTSVLNGDASDIPPEVRVLLNRYGQRIADGTVRQSDVRQAEGLSERKAGQLWAASKVLCRPGTPNESDAEAQQRGGASHHVNGDGDHVFRWTDAGGDRERIFTEAEWASVVRDYVHTSRGGRGMAMQDVAIRHGMSRGDFDNIRRAYGLTKSHEPFTVEHIKSTPLDELVPENVAMIRRTLAERVERESYADLRRMATKWMQFESGILDPFMEAISDAAPRPIRTEVQPASFGSLWGYQGSDLHLGLLTCPEYAIGVETYNRDIARRRWLHGLDETIARGIALHGGLPHTFLLVIGGDVAHVDNIHGATSSMRHTQDLDGIPDTILRDCVDMYCFAIDTRLARMERVHITCCPGNHDEILSRAMMAAVWARYKDDPRITWGNFSSSHAFYMFGNSAIVFHHGHGERTAESLGATLEGWLTEHGQRARYKYAITGNLHHFAAKEANGTILLQQSSPAASDRYHTLNGYDKSRSATQGFYFDAEAGLTAVAYIGLEHIN